MEVQKGQYHRLETIYHLLNSQKNVSANELIQLIEVTQMIEKYFTKEQLEKMKSQTDQFSAEEKEQMDNQWAQLVADIRLELEKNTPSEDPKVIELAKKWKRMTHQFTGGDQEIVKTAERFYWENPGNPMQNGVDRDLYQYIKEAISKI
ncbi:TipAS antibiotic-recognition domain-containing protein [Neobacillus niacini]|uniref:TipAS antibiotic-recognition domain-containing protein n=1 Tax=Neobacillus niacini TaxID=86668 RepID=UPI0037CB5480